MAGLSSQDDCGKHRCERAPEKTYTGPNGNTIRLCEKHYHNAVVRPHLAGGGTYTTFDLGDGNDDILGDSFQSVDREDFNFDTSTSGGEGEWEV